MIFQKRTKEKFGEILVKNGSITEEQLKRALDLQRQEGGLLGEVLIKLGYINEREIVEALTTQYGFPFLTLEDYDINRDMAALLPENVARQYNIVPLDLFGSLMTVAMSDPLNNNAIEDIEMITKKKVQVFIATITAINEAINRLYREKEQ